MKKKILIPVGLVVLVLLATSGFIVSAITVGKIKTALEKPLQLGVLTLHPGKNIQSQVGYFNSRVTIPNSTIESGQSRLDVPEIEVRLDGGKLFIHAARASGKIVQLQNAEVQITGLQLEAPYPGLVSEPTELSARITADTMDLTEPLRHYRFTTGSLDLQRAKHAFWDKLVLNVADFKSDGEGDSVSIRNFGFSQTQTPQPNRRLATLTQVHLDSIKYLDEKGQSEFSADSQDFKIGVTIDGDSETVFLATLREIEPDEASINHYLAKYNPTVDTISVSGSHYALNSKPATFACAAFRLESDYRQQNDVADSSFEAGIEKFLLSANGSRIEAGAVTWKSTVRLNANRYKQLVQLASNYQLHSQKEIVNAAFDLLDNYHATVSWSMNGFAFSEPAEAPPIRLTEASVDAAIDFDSGVGSLSISPKMSCTDPNSLPQLAALKLPIESFGADLGIALERINAGAFRPLAENLESSGPQTLITGADQALREFTTEKPKAQITVNISGKDGPALAVAFVFEIDRDLPKDFSLAPALQGDAALSQVLAAGIDKTASLRWTLGIDQYHRLLDLVDRLEGPGAGEQLLKQAAAFVKIKDERIEAELLIRDQQALLNGEPNPMIMFLANQLLHGGP